MPAVWDLLEFLGRQIAVTDCSEETFLLFSRALPALESLGAIDIKASSIDTCIGGKDYAIEQSPGLLSSSRAGGTTGAVIWKVTPAFAEWICSPSCMLFQAGVLHAKSTVLELGCGISGLIAMALSPHVRKYIASDQEYVFKLLRYNLRDHIAQRSEPLKKHARGVAKSETPNKSRDIIEVIAIDWETTDCPSLNLGSAEAPGIDVVLACDCIYNEQLVQPFVRTCTEICQLRQGLSGSTSPTVCVVAQQLRSDMVFECWLQEFCKTFKVWRVVPEDPASKFGDTGNLVIHIGVLQASLQQKSP